MGGWDLRLSIALLFTTFTLGLAHAAPELNPQKYVSPDPATPYKMQVEQPKLKNRIELPVVPPEYKDTAKKFTLPQLVDTAFKNNPSTVYAWAQALSKAADWATARGAYYPSLNGQADGEAGKIPATLGGRSFVDAGLVLNYLLFDFGGRSASVKQAKQALIGANLDHNQAIQDLLRDISQAYYDFVGKKALVHANEASLKESNTSLEAAEQRRMAGVATVSDVLQARSDEQQAVYNLASSKGDVEIARGKLATVAGWPSNTSYDTVDEMFNIPYKLMDESVDPLIEAARKNRADLNSAIANVRQKEEAIKQARAALYPQIVGTGNYLWVRNRDFGTQAYYGGVTLQIPIFQGFSLTSKLRSAKAQLKVAVESLEAKEEGIIQDVWKTYNNFKADKDKLSSANALLASATESFAASSARYKAGVADIVELMTTQSRLASARAQLIRTQMSFYNDFAELIHSIGAEYKIVSQEQEKPELLLSRSDEAK